jgi:hypothetical protein
MQKLLFFMMLCFSVLIINAQDTPLIRTAKSYTDSAGRKYFVTGNGQKIYLFNGENIISAKPLTLLDKIVMFCKIFYKDYKVTCWIVGVFILFWLIGKIVKLFS